jgi:hypothetical protein
MERSDLPMVPGALGGGSHQDETARIVTRGGARGSGVGGRVFEQVGEAFCLLGRIAGLTRRYSVSDLSEFELDGRPEPPRAVANERIETRDRTIEPLDGDHGGVPTTLPVVLEGDDLCHDLTLDPGSDTTSMPPKAPCYGGPDRPKYGSFPASMKASIESGEESTW